MKNKSRALALLLSVVQIVIAAMIIIFALHDIILYAIDPEGAHKAMIFLFLIDMELKTASIIAYGMLGVAAISLGVSIASLVVSLKWENPKAVFGMGIASIFGFNLAAGFVMSLSADKMNK